MSTPIGVLTLVASDVGLRAVLFESEQRSSIDIGSGMPSRTAIRTVDEAARQLEEYFAKDRQGFDLPLDLHGTDFQLAVWNSLAAVAYGETLTYREQADRLAVDGGARAVGAANGKNPVPIVLPCHRVVASDGALTGYVGGIAAKGYLLRLEEQRQPSLFDM